MASNLPRTLTELFDGNSAQLTQKMITTGLLDELFDRKLIIDEERQQLEDLPTEHARCRKLMSILTRRSDKRVAEFLAAMYASGQTGVLAELGYKMDDIRQFLPVHKKDVPGEVPGNHHIVDNRMAGGAKATTTAVKIVSVAVAVLGVVIIWHFSAKASSPSDKQTGRREAVPTNICVAAFKGIKAKLVDEIDVSSGLWTQLEDRNVLTGRQIDNCKSQGTQSEKIEKMLDIIERRCGDRVVFDAFCEALIANSQQTVVRNYFMNFYSKQLD